jgi:DNA-binding response OmpR family regulator
VEHIFDPFYQGPNATEGMGLGLALTRDIVVQHGGRIELVQEPNAGAIFRVTLPRTVAGEPAVTEGAEHAVAPDRPLSPEAPAAPHAMSPASAADDAVTPYVPASVHAPSAIPAVTSSSPFAAVADAKELLGGPSVRVLLVEDDYDLREFLRERIGVQHEVRTAETGEEALTLMQEWTPDVVISDIIMPGIDGLALCRILKADPATRNIPIMLLTAKGSAEDQERGLMVGADEYLVKPVDVRQLLLRIENLVRLKRSIEQRFKDTMPAWASVLMRGGVGKTMDRDAEQFVARLYRLLVERVGDPALDIDAMARGLNVSRSLLYRRIRESLDCSPHDLLMEVRLEQAALMLRTTDNTVAAIGGRVGFRTAPHFTRRFVAHFGMTPGEYRRRMAGG